MFEIVDVKNLNTIFFIKYHINDTMTISNSFTKFFFQIRKFFKEKEHDVNARKRTEKKEFKKR